MSPCLHVDIQVAAVPAEVQQGASGGGDALSRPAEEVELSERPGLLRLHVLQVEASHQEVVAPDVLRHQVHLDRNKKMIASEGLKRIIRGLPPLTLCSPHRCGTGTSPRQASSGHTVSLRPPPEPSSSQSQCSRSPTPSAPQQQTVVNLSMKHS